MECSYELAKSMLELAEKELDIVELHKDKIVEYAPHIANVAEYLAKALIYAINTDNNICKEVRRKHDVSKHLIDVYTRSPISLQEDDVRAIAGIAFFNAMLCNNTIRGIIRYGIEPLGILFREATAKSSRIQSEWKELLQYAFRLLKRYKGKVKDIVRRAEIFTIELTSHSFEDRRAKVLLVTLRPTARYAHARVRIRLHEDVLHNKQYKVQVRFKAGNEIKAPVRCEVCLWNKEGRLANDDDTGSPKDYIYLAGGEGTIIVKAGQVQNKVINEIEPRVWKPGGVKVIEIIMEEADEAESGSS